MAAKKPKGEDAKPAAPVLPTSGRTAQSMRLTYPGRWRSQAAASRFVQDNHLEQAGVSVVGIENVWYIVIDSHRVPMLTPWLRQQFPGILWAVSWTPKP